MIVQISLSYHICNKMSHTGTSQVELHANTEHILTGMLEIPESEALF